jgi:hypothetical protein
MMLPFKLFERAATQADLQRVAIEPANAQFFHLRRQY